MLVKEIKYVDFEGNDATEKAYFNLTKTELLEVAYSLPKEVEEVSGNDPNGISEEDALKLVEKLGGARLLAFVKDLILKAYGEKTDSSRFVKDPQKTLEFSQSLAFDAFVMELMQDENAASSFITSIIPRDSANALNGKLGLPNNPTK